PSFPAYPYVDCQRVYTFVHESPARFGRLAGLSLCQRKPLASSYWLTSLSMCRSLLCYVCSLHVYLGIDLLSERIGSFGDQRHARAPFVLVGMSCCCCLLVSVLAVVQPYLSVEPTCGDGCCRDK